MAYVKKSKMPKSWPVPRKGKRKRYVAKPSHGKSSGISLLFVLRDMLKIANTRKEVKFMTLNGDVKVNGRVRKDENFPMQVFDTMSLEKTGENYRLDIVNKKFSLKEIDAKDANKKIVKIVGKKIVSGGKVQMNLVDGQNFLGDGKFSVGDSAVVTDGKVSKVLPLKEGANVEIIVGKHAGEKGQVVKVEPLKKGKDYKIKLEDKEVDLPFKSVMVVE